MGSSHEPSRPLTAPSGVCFQSSTLSEDSVYGLFDQYPVRTGGPVGTRNIIPSDVESHASDVAFDALAQTDAIADNDVQGCDALVEETFPEVVAASVVRQPLSQGEFADLQAQMQLLHQETNNGLMGGTVFLDECPTACGRWATRYREVASPRRKGPKAWTTRPVLRGAR